MHVLTELEDRARVRDQRHVQPDGPPRQAALGVVVHRALGPRAERHEANRTQGSRQRPEQLVQGRPCLRQQVSANSAGSVRPDPSLRIAADAAEREAPPLQVDRPTRPDPMLTRGWSHSRVRKRIRSSSSGCTGSAGPARRWRETPRGSGPWARDRSHARQPPLVSRPTRPPPTPTPTASFPVMPQRQDRGITHGSPVLPLHPAVDLERPRGEKAAQDPRRRLRDQRPCAGVHPPSERQVLAAGTVEPDAVGSGEAGRITVGRSDQHDHGVIPAHWSRRAAPCQRPRYGQWPGWVTRTA